MIQSNSFADTPKPNLSSMKETPLSTAHNVIASFLPQSPIQRSFRAQRNEIKHRMGECLFFRVASLYSFCTVLAFHGSVCTLALSLSLTLTFLRSSFFVRSFAFAIKTLLKFLFRCRRRRPSYGLGEFFSSSVCILLLDSLALILVFRLSLCGHVLIVCFSSWRCALFWIFLFLARKDAELAKKNASKLDPAMVKEATEVRGARLP